MKNNQKMKLIKDLGTRKIKNNVKRYGIYECPICLKYFETRTESVVSGASTKCRECSHLGKNKTHGKSKTKLYKVWKGIRSRCNNANGQYFSNYGGRGISVCTEWEDYQIFEKWSLGNGYNPLLSIDRIDNNGNYEPSNCRWTTREVQMRNTRKLRVNNTSGYRGVRFRKDTLKYRGVINVDKKSISLGSFKYPWTAAYAYDSYVITHKLEHTRNF